MLLAFALALVEVNNVYAGTTETMEFQVATGQNVTTATKAIYAVSKNKCAIACMQHAVNGLCQVAAYHKQTKTCHLSLDGMDALINVQDPLQLVILPTNLLQTTPTTTAAVINQWVDSIMKFSSQYTTTSHCADQLKGTPDVYPKYGYDVLAWRPSSTNAEFIEAVFPVPVHVTGIEIYETFCTGSVTAILCYQNASGGGGEYVTLWSSVTPLCGGTASIFSPTLTGTCFSDVIRIETQGVGTNKVELDAVNLIGYL